MAGTAKSFLKTRRGRWTAILAGAWLLYTLGGFLIAPAIIKWQIGKQVPPLLHRNVTVEKVRVNPYVLSLGIYGLKLTETNGAEFAGVGEFYANLQLSSLFKSAWVLDEVRIGSPSATLVRVGELTFNFSNLLTNTAPAPSSTTNTPFTIPRAEIARISITNGTVTLADVTSTNEFRSRIAPIELLLTNFTTIPDRTSPHRFVATVSSGETIAWEGRVSVQPLGASGQLKVTGFNLPAHRRYLDDFMIARVVDGTVDLALEYAATLTPQQTNVVVTNLAVHVDRLRVVTASTGEEIGAVERASVEDFSASLAEKRITVGKIFARDGQGFGRRYPAESKESTRLLNAETIRELEKLFHELNDQWGWHLSAPDIVLTNFAPRFEDVTLTPPARLGATNLSVSVQGLSNASNAPVRFRVAVELPPGGSSTVTGEATLLPAFAKVNIESKNVDVRPMAPYVREFFPVNLLSGRAGADLAVVFDPRAGSNGLVQASGALRMEDFNTSQAPANTDLLRWKSFNLDGLKLTWEPLSVHVGEIGFDEIVTDLIIDSERQINFLKLAGIDMKSPGGKSEPAAKGKAALVPQKASTTDAAFVLPPVTVDTFRLNGAALRFKDESIKPTAFGGVKELSGTIKGLTTSPSLRAAVDFKGRVDEQGPFSIAGELQPFTTPFYIDLAVNSRTVSLLPVSPYFGEFAGYPIQKGAVGSELKWHVENRGIKAENVITINQLTLGKRTGSTNATKLPVKLGIALLTDTDGRIELKVPVSGSLDDPKFNIRQVVWRVIENLLVKAATAPFALLGSMFGGGGQELGEVDFAPGLAELDATATNRLEKLALALTKRPLLSLEIAGNTEPQSDREALVQMRFQDSIKALKVDELVAAGQPAVPLSEVKLDTAEYDRLLLKAFTNAFGPLPTVTNVVGSTSNAVVAVTNAAPPTPVSEAKPVAPVKKFGSGNAPKGATLLSQQKVAVTTTSSVAKPVEKSAPSLSVAPPAPVVMETASTNAVGNVMVTVVMPPREEMEGRLRARIQVTDDDLRQLQATRAQVVQRYLLAKPGLTGERVYLIDAAAGKVPTAPARQVKMALN